MGFAENVDGRFLILENDKLGGHLKRGDRWEPHFTKLVQELVRPGTVAVDAGANMGCNTVVLARTIGAEGRVYAFEPQRITFQQLCANCLLNGLPNVYPIPAALGDRERDDLTMAPLDYYKDWVNIANNRIGAGGEPIHVVTLDSFALDVSFLKVDVQGYEIKVLEGARETIARSRPLLFVEVEARQLERHGATSDELIQHIRNLEYKLIWICNDYPVDHLCVPSERPDLLEQALCSIDGEVKVIG